MTDKIKELTYNIKGDELEHFEKVRDSLLLDIEQCKSGVDYCKKQIERIIDELSMWEEIVDQEDNEKFKGIRETAIKCRDDLANQYRKAKQSLKLYETQYSQLSYIYNNRFTNLPIENGVCIIAPETISYCNIAHLLVLDRE